MSESAIHRIQVRGSAVPGVRARIEQHLSVRTTARPEGWIWGIYFDAPKDISLDFLRPDVLPPDDSPAPWHSIKAHSA